MFDFVFDLMNGVVEVGSYGGDVGVMVRLVVKGWFGVGGGYDVVSERRWDEDMGKWMMEVIVKVGWEWRSLIIIDDDVWVDVWLD